MSHTFLPVSLSAAALLCASALAQPTMPNDVVKLWTQTAAPPTSLYRLYAEDDRLQPMFRTNIGVQAHAQYPAQYPLPPATVAALCADDIWNQIDVFLQHGFAPNGRIGIMLQAFGSGGICGTVGPGDPSPYYFYAPALARPPQATSPGNCATPTLPSPSDPHDYMVGAFKPWLTPWYDGGVQDCKQWMDDFAARYRYQLALHNFPSLPEECCPANPYRFIFDMERDWSDAFSDNENLMFDGALGLVPNVPADSRSAQLPINGCTADMFSGWSPASGETLATLWAFEPQIATTNPMTQASQDRMRFSRICRQSMAAAMYNAVDEVVHSFKSCDTASPFPVPTHCQWSNYNMATTDGTRDEPGNSARPPFDRNGLPVIRASYHPFNHFFYDSHHNYANFHSPVSYAFDLGDASRLGGTTPSDYVVQSAREVIESMQYSQDPSNAQVFEGGATGWCTPWIASLNSYFASADHHRKLLSLYRSKRINEFNLFADDRTDDTQMLQLWRKFRHVVDQVYGFDIDNSNCVITQGFDPSTAQYAPVGVLEPTQALSYGDFTKVAWQHTVEVISAPPTMPPNGQNMYPNAAQLTLGMNVAKAHDPSRLWYTYSIADSAYLRVNLEYLTEVPDHVGNQDGGGLGIGPTVEILDDVSQAWVPVPMQVVISDANLVPDADWNSLGVGDFAGNGMKRVRTIVTGIVPNARRASGYQTTSQTAGRLVHWGLQDATGSLQMRVTVSLSVAPSIAKAKTHFDLVQVVGVDANDTDFDWNHDGTSDLYDLLQFTKDFKRFNNGVASLPTNAKLALDVNSDGVVDINDVCEFKNRLYNAGYLLVEQSPSDQFNTLLKQLGLYDTCPCALHPVPPPEDP